MRRERPASRIEEPRAGVDLERREERYLILPRDLVEVERRLRARTRLVEYPESPITRTIYLGDDLRGVPGSVTLKARSYAPDRLDAVWELGPDAPLDLLEVKRTIRDAEGAGLAFAPGGPPAGDWRQAVRIQHLARSRFPGSRKEKVRSAPIRLGEVLELLRAPRGSRPPGTLPEFLDRWLDDSRWRWRPVVGTEYRRRHFVREGPDGRVAFRATLDERIAYFSFRPEGSGFVGLHVGEEEAAGLEFKVASDVDPRDVDLGIEDLVRDFLLFPAASKKYRAMTAHGRRELERLGLFQEVPELSLEARVEEGTEGMRSLAELAERLAGPGAFRLLGEDPTVIESHRTVVEGFRDGLRVRFTGREIEWENPARTLRAGPVVVLASDRVPIGRRGIESHTDLAAIEDVPLAGLDAVHRRSRGVLLEARRTGRVYLAGLARESRTLGRSHRFVSVLHLGRTSRAPRLESTLPLEKDLVRIADHLRAR